MPSDQRIVKTKGFCETEQGIPLELKQQVPRYSAAWAVVESERTAVKRANGRNVRWRRGIRHSVLWDSRPVNTPCPFQLGINSHKRVIYSAGCIPHLVRSSPPGANPEACPAPQQSGTSRASPAETPPPLSLQAPECPRTTNCRN